MLTAKTRWDVKRPNPDKVNQLVQQLNIAPFVASLLVNRGIETAEAAQAFLYPAKQPLHDPFLLDGMQSAVERIHEAIRSGERILVFGDYDADGVSSTTVMMSVLTELGANVDFYIPNRFTEGYGPNEQAFRLAKAQGVALIITVDTGIAAVKEVALANELGMDVIITDHHEPGPVLPEALAIIHPKKPGSTYPFRELAGVGVAFKVAHALLGKVPEYLLDVVAIGTIADLVSLTGENRSLVVRGLEQLRKTTRIGVRTLLKQCGVNLAQINEETVGFVIAPRINAVGRLGDADPAVRLLMTNDETEAQMLAAEMEALNRERQQLVNDITEEAVAMIQDRFPPDVYRVLVVANEGWNAGVVGIVASRLVEQFYRPTIVLSIDRDKGIAKGSGRSIHGFDLFQHLSACRDILPHFGGHPMAAGMTLAMEHVDELRERLNARALETLIEEDFIPITPIDVVCSVRDVTLEAVEQLEQLAPFGVDNPKPFILLEEATVQTVRRIGTNQAHIKMLFEQEGATLDSVGFGYGYLHDEIARDAKVSVVGSLSVNEWNHLRKPQLMICDVAVREWQLFDWRGIKQVQPVFSALPLDKRLPVAFRPDTVEALQLHPHRDEVQIITSVEEAGRFSADGRYVVLLDLPPTVDVIKVLLSSSLPARIYALFYQRESHFFSTLPTRDHFKWFYAFLRKRGSFHLEKYGDELARSRGWTHETIHFMVQVFLDLQFLTLQNGVVELVNQPAKRDLMDSPTYRLKQAQLELEKMFLYSSYEQLKRTFSEIRGSQLYEEAKTWI
ncbi:single-stranded-DNA-specific exonuclease RecJ [Anoxybacillus sp. J5B_2022]|uniref:single-stranded-DNA-specific exonuclease RecJ n=1 Tax=Anoxybacillus sp. J5B_2022 TaxID=3003246 RepID=UPI0022866940|nr:single-stranded-DNA-specific exonuclease RecJ [Anoxybacillus sp. J5B_2022]MCZ0756120.1 single-stranded-DNA-specific exonuclease RecJ [Anoxybacillus sp. J5B_2022]